MTRDLVVVRCGRRSLHASWGRGGDALPFDVWLCPYEPIPASDDVPALAPVVAGGKWSGLARRLEEERSWRGYEHVWFPDDDLGTDAATVARLFARCREAGAALAAPSLSPDSQYSHPLTLRNESFRDRATTFVEIMAPCFARDALEELLPTFRASPSGHGWGLDDVWARLLRYEGLVVFDDVTVRHDRPVGEARTPAAREALLAEMRAVHRRFDACEMRKTRSGTTAGGDVVPETDPTFLATYVEGYRAVWTKEPPFRARLLRHQAKSPSAWLEGASRRAFAETDGAGWRARREARRS